MQVYKLAKQIGLTTKQLITDLDNEIDHHMDKLDDETVAYYLNKYSHNIEQEKPAPEVAKPQIAVVEPVKKETVTTSGCPVSLEILELSLRGVGKKSPYWEYRGLLKGNG